MQEEVLIKVENVSKKFTRSIRRSMAYGAIDLIRDFFGIPYDVTKLRKGEFWSLSNINFEVKKGEGIGIIGSNGSGKSTLLRLLGGIFPPDVGSIYIKGKLGALIAVGAGFHPHMSGRENIYLNGTILGMTKTEIEARMHDIISFADIGEFLDAPVSTYSSGMTVRLGFSIAIHSKPEILLADEVLAVGDLQFALKCHRKIAELRREGCTVILVSHNLQQVRNACERAIWINKGKVVEFGEVNEVCDRFENFMYEADAGERLSIGTHITNDEQAQISTVKFLDGNNQEKAIFQVGESLLARIFYKLEREVKHPIFTFGVASPENISTIVSFSPQVVDTKDITLKGEGYVEIAIPQLLLKPGNYRCTVTMCEGAIENVLDWHEKNFIFTVESKNKASHGLLQLPVSWNISESNKL